MQIFLEGGGIYVLDLLCNHDEAEIRECAAELLGKVQSDKLHGPRWSRFLTKFLPPIFMDAMRDSPKACVQLFDSTTENPELIWNDDSRSKVGQTVNRLKSDICKCQLNDPTYVWKVKVDYFEQIQTDFR